MDMKLEITLLIQRSRSNRLSSKHQLLQHPFLDQLRDNSIDTHITSRDKMCF